MKLTFVGCGSAFNKLSLQSNMLLEAESGKKMLIDCGSYAHIGLLSALGINETNYADEIDSIYISHQHGDHIDGLEEIAFCTYFNPNAPKIALYCEQYLMHRIWDESLKGGLGSVQGKVMHLTDYFDCRPLNVNVINQWEGINFELVQTLHVMNGFEFVPSYGLMIKEEKVNAKNIFLTTDTQHCPNQIQDFYDMADVIFHDCETAPYFSGVHARYDELKTLNKETKKKMWLYHYQPEPPQMKTAREDGFRGLVTRGQSFKYEVKNE